jgi:Amt family ammonium transporter
MGDQMAYDSGDSAWVFACTALVMLLVVGIALFHSGMGRVKSSLTAIMLVAGSTMAVSVAWVFVGFSLAYGPDSWSGLFGSLEHAGLVGIAASPEFAQLSIPPIGLALFHMTVALVAAAILTGVAIDRMKFGAMLAFMTAWSILVYPTVAHWALGQDGWLKEWGVLDFGSGTLVGLTAGASALALTLVLGPRRTVLAGKEPRPHSLPLALAGAGLIWVGWIGVTAGSALEAGGVAASAALATHVAAVGGTMGWLLVEKRMTGVVTASGAAWGGIAGLAAITPAAGYLDPFASIFLGFVAGVTCVLLAAVWRRRIDDPLGAARVHGISAALGMVFVGLFGRLIVGADTEPVGALLAGDPMLLGKQVVAIVAVCAFAFLSSWLIAFAVRAAAGLRVSPEAEESGIDAAQLGEGAYGHDD